MRSRGHDDEVPAGGDRLAGPEGPTRYYVTAGHLMTAPARSLPHIFNSIPSNFMRLSCFASKVPPPGLAI